MEESVFCVAEISRLQAYMYIKTVTLKISLYLFLIMNILLVVMNMIIS